MNPINASIRPSVEVLLATYNGERFLRDQIDSILAQTGVEVHILARDDGSQDRTREILQHYAETRPDAFTVLPASPSTGSPKGNFLKLMQASTAQYIAFADQDDVWHNDKLERSLGLLQAMEAQHHKVVPLLVFTDLQVVDQDLNEMSTSFWGIHGILPDRVQTLHYLLAQNPVTGCTAVVNRALIEKANVMPQDIYMHDWWVAEVACLFGKARALKQTTVQYRQHGSNVVGALAGSPPNRTSHVRNHAPRREQMERSLQQTSALLRIYGNELTDEQRNTMQNHLRSGASRSRLARIYYFLRGRFFNSRLPNNLAMIWYLWDMDHDKLAQRMDATG